MNRVSVIIPCYNVATHIEKALLSALGQSEQPGEIICVDDCSTDETVARIKSLQQTYPHRIQLFVNAANRGATYTRNRGLAVARGEYIQFLDADDVLLTDKIKHQLSIADSSAIKPDIIVGRFKKVYPNGREIDYGFTTTDPWAALLNSKLGITSSILFNREKTIAVRGWADHLKSSQEYELMYRMLKEGATIVFDDALKVINCVRQTSITRSDPADFWKRYIYLRVGIYNHLQKQGQLTPERKQVFVNIVFDALRFLYDFDPQTAVRLHDQYLLQVGQPQITASTSARYLKLYQLVGFRSAQLLARFFNVESTELA